MVDVIEPNFLLIKFRNFNVLNFTKSKNDILSLKNQKFKVLTTEKLLMEMS
jgi:hypothetical protein